MGVLDKKRDVMNKVAIMDILSNTPKPSVSSSLESVNNKLSSTDFLVDLTTTLVGAKALKDYVIDTVTHRLPQVEEAIKDGLKLELKELVSCNVNPSIPTWFQNGGTGVTLKVTDIDFYDIMKTNPNSLAGGLIYTDIVPPGTTSTDFNTYLYNTIQTPTTPTSWASPLNPGVDILETVFNETTTTTTTQNNVVTYTTSAAYSGKKLTDFNNDFIDSLSLFGNPFSLDSGKMISLILEELFGSITSTTNKSKKQIEKEIEIGEVLECISNSENSNISDSFFTFDNPTLARIDRESNNRRNGIRELQTCGNLPVQVTAASAVDALAVVTTATTKADETKAVTEALNNLADKQASFATSETNGVTIRTNFFIEIIKKFQRIIMSSVLTPEFMSLFAINHQIIYGQGSSYGGPIDFMKKNRKLIKNICKVVLNILLKLLLNLVLLYITIRLKEKFADDQIEKAKDMVITFLSLTGVPPVVLDQIRRINTQPIPNLN